MVGRLTELLDSPSRLSPFGEGEARAELRFMTRAPASALATIASASSSGVALGIPRLLLDVSAKMGRNNSVHPGQIAGATEPRRAQSIPATNVACVHAIVSARAQVPSIFPRASRMVAPARSGWSSTTGPSINATIISTRPWLSSIKAGSPTSSRGLIGVPATKFWSIASSTLFQASGRANCIV